MNPVTEYLYNNSIDSLVDEMIDRHIDGQDEFEMIRARELKMGDVIMDNHKLIRVRSIKDDQFSFCDYYDSKSESYLRISINSRQWVLRKK